MALYMMFYEVPNHHLDYLKEESRHIYDYIKGKKPDIKPSFLSKFFSSLIPKEVPEDWPNRQLEEYSPEINHNQVKLYHYILNGTDDVKDNVGCLFQTWYKPRKKCKAIAFDADNFAFKSSEVQELAVLLNELTNKLIIERCTAKIEGELSPEDSEYIIESFNILKKVCANAIAKGNGILWTAN